MVFRLLPHNQHFGRAGSALTPRSQPQWGTRAKP